MSFIFGGDTNMTYEQAKRQQQMARQLMGQNKGRSKNVGEGIASFTEQITNAMMGRRANKEMDRQQAEFNDRFKQAYPQAAGSQAFDMYSDPRASDSQRDIIKALNSGVPGFRYGTGYAPGGMAVVGEDGPELVNLPQGAQVVPNPQTQAAMVGDAPQAQSRFMDDQAFQAADVDAFKLMQLSPEYAEPVEADLNTTEGQRIALLRRMMFSDLALEDPRLTEAMTRGDNNLAKKFGALGRLYTDDEFEMGSLMAEQFANAVLRNDSGAAAPDSEVQRYAGQYFPQSFEGENQLNAKKALRREMIRSMTQALGGDAAPAVQQMRQEIEELRKQADDEYVAPAQEAAPVEAAPEGVPQELWDVLTPEEKTAWAN